jgi:hypothetical protein
MSDSTSIRSSSVVSESCSGTRSLLIPRHITPSHKDLALGRFSGTARLCFFGFQKICLQFSAENGDQKKIFQTFRKSAAGPWERGTLARWVTRTRFGQNQ